MKDIKHILKETKFANLWTSQVLSQLVINIMNYLLLIRIYSVTESTIATSFLWIAYALPALFVGPLAAVFVDFWDRRKVLVITNLAQAITIFVFALFYKKFIFLSYAVIATYSLFNQFYVPAEAASLPALVNKKDLAQTNALFFLTQQASLVVGFGVAGFLYEILGYSVSLILCSFALVVAFVSVYFLPKMPHVLEKNYTSRIEGGLLGFFTEIFEGYRFIKNHKFILLPFILLLGMQVFLSTLVVIVPSIAKEIIGTSPNTSGILIVVPGGLGSGMGAYFVTKILRRGVRKNKLIMRGMFLAILSIFIISAILPVLPLATRIVGSFAVFFTFGLGMIAMLIPSQTYLQESTPEGMQGRVFGNFWFLTTAASILPILFTATLVDLIGIRLLLFTVVVSVTASILIAKKMKLDIVYGENKHAK